jgi:hypothetical protein
MKVAVIPRQIAPSENFKRGRVPLLHFPQEEMFLLLSSWVEVKKRGSQALVMYTNYSSLRQYCVHFVYFLLDQEAISSFGKIRR